MKIALSWSSGKDSAWTLHALRAALPAPVGGGVTPPAAVGCLVTTLNESADRVAMHAVRRQLLEAQAGAAGLPLVQVPLPAPCTNDVYESRMRACLADLRAQGYTHMAFGDLFLEDVRAYRVKLLAGSGLEPLFPIWGEPTPALARKMIASGLKAVLTCVDPRVLPESFAGRAFDAQLLADLPPGVDPCGENGEFHTFCHAGPMFHRPLDVVRGDVVTRDGFCFADVRPA